MEPLKLYSVLARWWPLISEPADYRDEAEFFAPLLAADGATRTVLELGSGGGNNALHLKEHFEMTLSDLSAEMLAVSRKLNPELEHIEGDMRSVRVGRMFDAVFIHDAIEYMTTEADLRAAVTTAFEHCRPGGVAVMVPDYVRETFVPSTDHGGHDDGHAGARYLEWTYDTDASDTKFEVEFAVLVRDVSGEVRAFHDRHTFGLFPRALWFQILEEAGFEARSVIDRYQREVFVATRPERSA